MRDDDDGSMRDLLVSFLSRCHEGTVFALNLTIDVIVRSCTCCVEQGALCGAVRRDGGVVGCAPWDSWRRCHGCNALAAMDREPRCGLGDRFGDRQHLAHFRMVTRSIRHTLRGDGACGRFAAACALAAALQK